MQAPRVEERAAFEDWMIRKGRALTTARQRALLVGAIHKRNTLVLADYEIRTRKAYRGAWNDWRVYMAEVHRTELPAMENAPSTTERLREAVSLPLEEWRRVLAALDPNDRRDQVIRVLALTGMRISDVLRTDHASLSTLNMSSPNPVLHVVQKGSKNRDYQLQPVQLEAFRQLRDGVIAARSINVAAYVSGKDKSDAKSPAYRAVNERLGQVRVAAQVTGRLHFHRFRRTIAIFILNGGGSHEEVRDALGQRSVRSAQIYADEVQSERALSHLGSILEDKLKGR
jgi:integrase